MFRSLRNPTTGRPAPRRPRGRRFQVEALEGRQLLSIGGPSRISIGPGVEDNSANASAPDGRMVSAWVSQWQGSPQAIRAQLFNANKTMNGTEITVDLTPAGVVDSAPRVAMSANDKFVVTWSSFNKNNGLYSAWAELFSSSGKLIRKDLVGDSVAGSDKWSPDVAMDRYGDFTVSYLELYSNGTERVDAEVFDGSGFASRFITVDTSTPKIYFVQPRVEMSPTGAIDVAYNKSDGGPGFELELASFNGSTLLYRNGLAYQSVYPFQYAVAMNSSGGLAFALDYENVSNHNGNALYVERVTAAGKAYDFFAVDTSGTLLNNPTIACDPKSDQLVVAYDSYARDGVAGHTGVRVLEVGANDKTTGSYEFGVASAQFASPALSIDGSGNYFLTYSSGDGQSRNIWDNMGLLKDLVLPPANKQPPHILF